jgi:ppGpp synthetase/RelA/SpoT-type nucleotidyltranferase
LTRLAVRRRAFIKRYRQEYSAFKQKAQLAENFVRSILEDCSSYIYKIESRAKDPDSANFKVFRKRYGNPAIQMTDRIAVRVVTYHPIDVDTIVQRLKAETEVDYRRRRTVDKRRELGPASFGYRSVHLIVQLKPRHARRMDFSELSGVWFEVQVRSMFEHAWAEIDHEVTYKSGILYPDEVVRRFAAIAGTLEIVGAAFYSFKEERNKLIEEYRIRYQKRQDRNCSFDSARLIAFMEDQFPNNPGWRKVEIDGRPFPPRIESTCVEALRACHLSTADSLGRFMTNSRFRNAVRSFAALQRIPLNEVTHLALVVNVISLRNRGIFREFFPSFLA